MEEILIFILNWIGCMIIWFLIYNNKEPDKKFIRNIILIIIAIVLVKLQ